MTQNNYNRLFVISETDRKKHFQKLLGNIPVMNEVESEVAAGLCGYSGADLVAICK